MSDLEHLQSVLLSIMKDLDAMCQKHGIQYYLLGGTAIGAIRHHGFIPWDDDLDIIMDNDNYQRFISICKEDLDPRKYALQEGLKDWPVYFSKVRLLGTVFKETVEYTKDPRFQGIYIDVFKMDNVSSNRIVAWWQYLCGKYYLCYQLLSRSDIPPTFSFGKRIAMALSFPLKIKAVRQFVQRQVEQFNGKPSEYLGFFYGRTRLRTSIVRKDIFGSPVRVPFEDTMLPVAEHYHEYLTQMFGDYMTPPPVEKQMSLHMEGIDFGSY